MAEQTPAVSTEAAELAALLDHLHDLLAGSKEVRPYEDGDDVGGYCGKACGSAIKHVRVSNVNDPKQRLVVFCSTRGCSCSMKVSDLPVRYRVSREELAHAAVKALPNLLAARTAQTTADHERAVNDGVRLAAQLVRDHVLGGSADAIAGFLEARADRVMPAANPERGAMNDRIEHGDHRVCELQDDGTWKVLENPTNRGVVGLSCDRPEHAEPGVTS